jgi:hypothetical protein
LSLTRTGSNAVLTWPIYPAGFAVETTASLAPANWLPFTGVPLITNQQNQLLLNLTNAGQFFRLRLP